MADPPPSEGSPADPLVTSLLDDATAPYRDLVAPDLLALMRAALDTYLSTHPVPAGLVDELRPRPEVDASAPLDRSGQPAEPLAHLAPSGTEGDRR